MFLDIQEVCQHVDQEISQQPAETPTQVREKFFFVSVFLVGLFVSFHSPLLVCFPVSGRFFTGSKQELSSRGSFFLSLLFLNEGNPKFK